MAQFSETWTRVSTKCPEMIYRYMSDDPAEMNDYELASSLGLGWIKKLTVKRDADEILIYAGRRHWATVYPK